RFYILWCHGSFSAASFSRGSRHIPACPYMHDLQAAHYLPIYTDSLCPQLALVAQRPLGRLARQLGCVGRAQEQPQRRREARVITHTSVAQPATLEVEVALGGGLLATLALVVDDHGGGEVDDSPRILLNV